eukprot:15360363-Ditylum_brightwellii.AAC.1
MPKREVHAPLESGDYPEIDDSPLLDMEDIKKYWLMIGEMRAPCQGHLKHLKFFYCFLHNYKKTAIKFDTELPDCSNYKVEKKNWGHIYHPC